MTRRRKRCRCGRCAGSRCCLYATCKRCRGRCTSCALTAAQIAANEALPRRGGRFYYEQAVIHGEQAIRYG